VSTPPEDRIREHLQRKGATTTVELRRLLGTWGAEQGGDADRARVAGALRTAGIDAAPSILRAGLDEMITLTLAPAAAAAAPEVAIPPSLPRALLTFGGTLVLVALFLPWFGGSTAGVDVPELSTGWEWLSVLDLLLVLVVAATALLLFTDALGDLGPRLVAGLGTLGLAAVSYRIVSPPTGRLENFVIEVAVKVGPFVELLALVLVVSGAGLRVASPSREGTVLPDGQAPGRRPT